MSHFSDLDQFSVMSKMTYQRPQQKSNADFYSKGEKVSGDRKKTQKVTPLGGANAPVVGPRSQRSLTNRWLTIL